MCTNPTASQAQQRHAAVVWVARRTPSEAARELLADPRVIHPADIGSLASILARRGPMTPEAHQHLVRIATPLLPVGAAA